jgi:ribonuclease J
MPIDFKVHDEELLFLPLGGSNEVGMNFNCYRYKGKWLLIDCGIGFADDYLPGVDVVVPNIDAITPFKKDIVGLVITHAHEDHVGAVALLWPELQCPVYTTPFTAAVLKNKLTEEGLQGRVKVHEVQAGREYPLGPFSLEVIPLTHSIPEMHAIAVKTDAGTVMHTGDWKLDADPLVGPTTDEDTLRRYGDAGVLAMVCDSTNVFVEGESGSEADVRASLRDIIADCQNRAVVTLFASNVARLETVIRAAQDAGREVALSGKSLWRMSDAARQSGYLEGIGRLLTEEQGMELPRSKVVFIVTGCQGESRAALSKIARGDHPAIRLSPGDTIIFSSRTIPGNETKISWVHNQLVLQGLEVINDYNGFVHVSGHPARMELERMYQLVRPKIAVPTHGEARHLREHVNFARQLQVPEAVEATNGAVIRLKEGAAQVVGHVPSGYLALDGNSLIATDSSVIRTRRKIRDDGFCAVSVVIDKRGKLVSPPKFSAPGSLDFEDDRDLFLAMREEMEALIDRGRFEGKSEMLEQKLRNVMRRFLRDELGKKPVLDVHVHVVR